MSTWPDKRLDKMPRYLIDLLLLEISYMSAWPDKRLDKMLRYFD
jgi:hypothetical protein